MRVCVGEVCQHAYSCQREASISVAVLEINLLRGYGDITELRVLHFIHHMLPLFVQMCKYVTCDRDGSPLLGPRFMNRVTERR